MEYLNSLINVAQAILDNRFDVQAFLSWRNIALLTLLSLLGPLHYYTQTFKQVTAEQDSQSLLAGEGVLMAAKEEMLKTASGFHNNG